MEQQTCFGFFCDEVFQACRFSADPNQVCDNRDACIEATKAKGEEVVVKTNADTAAVVKVEQVLQKKSKEETLMAAFLQSGFQVEQKKTCWKINLEDFFTVSITGTASGNYGILLPAAKQSIVTEAYSTTSWGAFQFKTAEVDTLLQEVARLCHAETTV